MTEPVPVSRKLEHAPADDDFAAELVGMLHRWRDTVHLFNRRLDLTEVSTFSNTISSAEPAAFRRALHREDSYFAATRSMLQELLDKLPRS